MLRRLHIRNYLLIEALDLPLENGLTIITGETGSGKSILIGALALAMGERAETGALRDPGGRCVIELEVDLGHLDLAAWFSAQELPYETRTIMRRQLEPGGRSRAFINDTPVKLEQLRELGSRLLHVHSQHHTLLLNDTRFQLGLVDHLAGNAERLRAYQMAHAQWREVERDLERLRTEAARSKAEMDFLQFQLNELDQARLQDGEQERLEQELARADHAEELQRCLKLVEEGITADRGVQVQLATIRQALARPARLDAGVNILLERLNAATIELKDIADEAEHLIGRVELDPREAQQKRERLDELLRLQQKHRVSGTAELIAIRDDLSQRTRHIGSLDERIEDLASRTTELSVKAMTLAKELSKERTKAVKPLALQLERILHDLGMPDAVLQFDHCKVDIGPQGLDAVRALFTANKDRAPAPLDKVASGGELSRVMLALISLAADSQGLSTVIFDEIDTGVSGEVADRVGSLMARMGKERQVLAITHLPQIASKATHHLLVSKSGTEGRVSTTLSQLNAEQRVEAIAQMLSGRKLTKQALENARVLLKQR